MGVELVTGRAGKPHVTSFQVGEFNRAMFGDGIYILGTANKCATNIVSANKVEVKSGDVLAYGRHINISSTETLEIKSCPANKKRHDIICLDYKKSSGVETVSLVVIEGEPDAAPSDPRLRRSSRVSQYTSEALFPLYRVIVDGITIKEVELHKEATLRANPIDEVLDKVYPIGAVYISFNSTSPDDLFGGNWKRIEDRFLLAAKYFAGEVGGEKEHKLTVDEMPNHVHSIDTHPYDADSSTTYKYTRAGTGVSIGKDGTDSKGGDKPHNNMPPYITVYMWQRMA